MFYRKSFVVAAAVPLATVSFISQAFADWSQFRLPNLTDAFSRDAAGNLYVGDNDNQKVYKFTAVQLSLAISGTPLAITDGTFVYQSINSLGSMAVDGLGRIWSSGYLANGLQVYDPTSNTE